MAMGCSVDVVYDYNRHRDEDMITQCGEWRSGTVLCDACLAKAEQRYPQGWSYYPGDVCKHGMYTGGTGIDWMCGPCEMGD
jgi:hypothetical protein